jgi:hypothetical protein
MKDIDRTFEQCEAECDECTTSTTVDSTDYTEINEQLRSDGWIIKYINGEWYEFCSMKCMREFLNNN